MNLKILVGFTQSIKPRRLLRLHTIMHNGCLYLFWSNVLQVLLHHDLSQTGLNQSLCAFSLSWPVCMKPRIINHPVWSQREVHLTSYDYLYVCVVLFEQSYKTKRLQKKPLFKLNNLKSNPSSVAVCANIKGKCASSLGLWCWVHHGTNVSSLIPKQGTDWLPGDCTVILITTSNLKNTAMQCRSTPSDGGCAHKGTLRGEKPLCRKVKHVYTCQLDWPFMKTWKK